MNDNPTETGAEAPHITFRNEVGGFSRIGSVGTCDKCSTPDALRKIQTDEQFYSELVDRFSYKERLEAFREEHHFNNHTVIGLHIRAGNGEQGDFLWKNRGISDEDAFLELVASGLEDISQDFLVPPLLFVATDTFSLIGRLRERLEGAMPVVSYPQAHPEEGTGVARLWRSSAGEECLTNWESVISDMMMVSTSDMVVAGRASTFVHSMPMSLAFQRESKKEVAKPYCEVVLGELKCFDSIPNWCCEGQGDLGGGPGLRLMIDVLKMTSPAGSVESE